MDIYGLDRESQRPVVNFKSAYRSKMSLDPGETPYTAMHEWGGGGVEVYFSLEKFKDYFTHNIMLYEGGGGGVHFSLEMFKDDFTHIRIMYHYTMGWSACLPDCKATYWDVKM